MNFKTKSELLVLVFRINVISDFGCRSPHMDFQPPFSGVFRLSHLWVIAGYPMQTVIRFSRFDEGLQKAYHNEAEIFRKHSFRFFLGFLLKYTENRKGCFRFLENALDRAYHKVTRFFRTY